ncbi:MAG: hypothetical protein N2037_12745 [Acidimicrobiales bacterium]|nr:hypothetical protein [Acidimicrobiales bacterium]
MSGRNQTHRRRSVHRGESAVAGNQARRLAVEALRRIDEDDAFANLVLAKELDRLSLPSRDRRLVTELVYGTTRMRRACDHLVDRFVLEPPGAQARALLRVGAYQLLFTGIPPYAAISATVAAAPPRLRGFVNAVLRRCSDAVRGGADAISWPDDATRLSYPDWIIDLLVGELGRATALASLEAMNQAPSVTTRDDGYIQDLASQWVAVAVGARSGERVLDTCAAPGGKATLMARSGATVVAMDRYTHRAGLIRANAARLGLTDRIEVVVADAQRLPFGTDGAVGTGTVARFDRVLVDAPCSGLGALRRRPDARWRIEAAAVERLAELQREMLAATVPFLGDGARLVYSVCTMTRAETIAIDQWLRDRYPNLEPVAGPPPEGAWRPWGRGWLVLPQDAGTDGMFLLQLEWNPT